MLIFGRKSTKYIIVFLAWKLDNPYCHTASQETYGLVGIAFETYGTGSQTVTRFINIQSHRKWIETVKWSIPGKKKNIFTLWSRSEEDEPNDRGLELDSNTAHSQIGHFFFSYLLYLLVR